MKTDNESVIKFICGSIIALSVVVAYSLYWINDRKLMAQNIETAISKGIDPLSVRCSYAHGQDPICIALAASSQPHNSFVQLKK